MASMSPANGAQNEPALIPWFNNFGEDPEPPASNAWLSAQLLSQISSMTNSFASSVASVQRDFEVSEEVDVTSPPPATSAYASSTTTAEAGTTNFTIVPQTPVSVPVHPARSLTLPLDREVSDRTNVYSTSMASRTLPNAPNRDLAMRLDTHPTAIRSQALSTKTI